MYLTAHDQVFIVFSIDTRSCAATFIKGLPDSPLMDPKRKKLILSFINSLGVGKIDPELINQALTHKSFTNEVRYSRNDEKIEIPYNQRLEFLGDAVLGLVSAGYLYNHYPQENEGSLTKRKAMAVCEPTLTEVGQKLKIGDYLLMGKGELQTGGNTKSSNIADALEAVIGAIYLNGGYQQAEKFIINHWEIYLNEGRIAEFSIDHKSKLQEILIQRYKIRPEYRVISTSGPEHQKIFEVGLFIQGEVVSKASAKSRKKSEQKAAYQYLQQKEWL